MDHALDACLSEFTSLRGEIAERSRGQWALSALNITASATVWSVVLLDKAGDDVLLVLAFLSPALGSLWINHAVSIRRIATYIETVLARHAAELTGETSALGWERWLSSQAESRRAWLGFSVPHLGIYVAAPAVAVFAALDSLSGWWWAAAAAAALVIALHALQWAQGLHRPIPSG